MATLSSSDRNQDYETISAQQPSEINPENVVAGDISNFNRGLGLPALKSGNVHWCEVLFLKRTFEYEGI